MLYNWYVSANISVKEYNKISNHKDLKMEIGKLWYVKTTIILVVVAALGMIKKKRDKHINKI